MEFAGTGPAIAPSLTERLLKTTLDTLPNGMVLVDCDERIVHSNATAALAQAVLCAINGKEIAARPI
jgi:hypothetical protein